MSGLLTLLIYATIIWWIMGRLGITLGNTEGWGNTNTSQHNFQ